MRNAISGRLVPASDPVALAEAMLSILDDRELAGRKGSAGRAWVLECGSFRSMAERYAAVYAGMVFA